MKHLLIIISLLLSCNKNSTSPDLCLNQDYDNDGICDSEDDCIGEYDCINVCNGSSLWCLDDDGYLDNYHDFQLIFENSNSLKACSMNIFKKSHRFTYEQYLQNIKNAILY